MKPLLILLSAILFFAACKTDRVDSIQDILTALSPKEQETTIDPSKENIIEGKKGTKIYIPENAFVFKDGSLPQGKVTVTVKECYSVSDWISNKLSTISNNYPLVTGGMINIVVSADGKQLEINKDKSYVIAFPNGDTTKRMEPFYGKTDSAGQVTWNTMFPYGEGLDESGIDTSLIDSSMYKTKMRVCGYIYSSSTDKVDDIIEWKLLHRDSTVFKYVENNFPYTDSSVINAFCKRGIYPAMKLFINAKGKVIRVDFDTDRDYDTVPTPSHIRQFISDFLKSMPPFDMNSMKMQDSEEGYHLSLCCHRSLNREEYDKRFKEKYSKYRDKFVDQMGQAAVNYYVMSVARLGWINCDHFLNDESDKTDLIVTIPEAKDAMAFITFSEIKCIMQGTETNGRFVFKNIPVNSKVKLIGVSYKDGKPLLSKIPVVVTKQPVTLSGFKEFSLDELEKQLNE